MLSGTRPLQGDGLAKRLAQRKFLSSGHLSLRGNAELQVEQRIWLKTGNPQAHVLGEVLKERMGAALACPASCHAEADGLGPMPDMPSRRVISPRVTPGGQ